MRKTIYLSNGISKKLEKISTYYKKRIRSRKNKMIFFLGISMIFMFFGNTLSQFAIQNSNFEEISTLQNNESNSNMENSPNASGSTIPSLVGLWSFEGGNDGGKVIDGSHDYSDDDLRYVGYGGNDGYGTASTTLQSSGYYGKAVQFAQSTSDSIIINDPDGKVSIQSSGFSWGAWVYVEDFDNIGSSGGAILWKNNEYGLKVISNGVNDDNKGYFQSDLWNGEFIPATTSTAYDENTWYHVMGSYDGSYLRTYVDGELKAEVERSSSGISPTTAQLLIGSQGTQSNNEFGGMVDDVRLYGIGLEQYEIEGIMNQEIYYSNLVDENGKDWDVDGTGTSGDSSYVMSGKGITSDWEEATNIHDWDIGAYCDRNSDEDFFSAVTVQGSGDNNNNNPPNEYSDDAPYAGRIHFDFNAITNATPGEPDNNVQGNHKGYAKLDLPNYYFASETTKIRYEMKYGLWQGTWNLDVETGDGEYGGEGDISWWNEKYIQFGSDSSNRINLPDSVQYPPSGHILEGEDFTVNAPGRSTNLDFQMRLNIDLNRNGYVGDNTICWGQYANAFMDYIKVYTLWTPNQELWLESPGTVDLPYGDSESKIEWTASSMFWGGEHPKFDGTPDYSQTFDSDVKKFTYDVSSFGLGTTDVQISISNGYQTKQDTITVNILENTPNAPTLDTVSYDTSQDKIKLTWSKPGFEGSPDGLDEYNVYRKVNSGGYSQISSVSASTTEWYDDDTSTFSPNDQIYYYVTAELTGGSPFAGESVASNEKTIGINAPGKPSVTNTEYINNTEGGNNYILIEWSGPGDTGLDNQVESYNIYRADPATPNDYVFKGSVNAPSTSYQDDASAFIDGTYNYKISASSTHWEGLKSDAQSVSLSYPGKPVLLGNFEVVNGKMYVDWTSPTPGNPEGVDYYEVYRKTNSGGTYSKIKEVDGSKTEYYDDTTTFTQGNTYYYKIIAVSELGAGLESDPESVAPIVPSQPSWGDPALNIESSGIKINWNLNDYGTATSIASYEIYRNDTKLATISSGSDFDNQQYLDTNGLEAEKNYIYSITATSTVGSSINSTERIIQFIAPPSPPSIVASSSGNGWVKFEWEDSQINGDPLLNYFIYRNEEYLNTLENNILEYNDTEVTNGQTYSYYIKPFSNQGFGGKSDYVIETPSTIPAEPLSLGLDGGYKEGFGDGWLNLKWSEPSDDGGATIQDYRIYRSDDGGNTFSLIESTLGGPVTTYNDTGLTNGITYSYKVQAYNSRGWGTANSSTFTDNPRCAPYAPTLNDPVEKNGEVSLAWTEPYDGSVPIMQYRILYRELGDTSWLTEFETETNTDLTLENGITYEFKILAENSVGLGEESEIKTAVPHDYPEVPTILTQQSNDGSYSFTWNNPEDNGRPITGFNLYWGYSEVSINNLVDLGDQNSLLNDSADVRNGQEYWFQLAAYNNLDEEGALTNPFMIRPMKNPEKVSNVQANAGNNQTQITWDAIAETGGDSIPLEHYEIWRKSDINPEFINIYNTSSTSYIDKTTNNGHQYWYKVNATTYIDITNTTDDVCTYKRFFSITSDVSNIAEPKTIPNSPEVSGIEGDEQNTITWNKPFNGGDEITGFNIYRRKQTNEGQWIGAWETLASMLDSTTVSYLDLGITNNQTYVYNVTAVNNLGESNRTANAQIVLRPFGNPLKIQEISTEHSSTYILLNWTWNDTMANGRDAQKFRIERNTSYDPYTWETIDTISLSNLEEYTDYDVEILSWYAYRISVENQRGWSDYSDPVIEECNSGIPSSPYDLQLTAEGDTEITITWNYNATDGSVDLDRGYFENYKIYRGTSPGSTNNLIHTELNNETQVFTDTGLRNGKQYYYTVTATNHYGESGKSSDVSAIPYGVPNATTIIDVFPLDQKLNISWNLLGSNYQNEPFDGGRPIDFYHVYRNNSQDIYEEIATVSGDANYYIDDDQGNLLTNGEYYGYKIIAENDRGEGPMSSLVTDFPCRAPHSPDLKITKAIEEGVYLNWTVPADGGDSIDGYRIYGGTNPGSLILIGSTTAGTTEWTNTSGDFSWGNMHYFEICAYNRKGNGDFSNRNQTLPIIVPDAPENFIISQIHNGSIELDWNEPQFTGGDNVDISGYIIYYKNLTVSEGWMEFDTANSDTTVIINNLINGYEYEFKISAYNNGSRDQEHNLPGGEGINSSNTVKGIPFGVPNAPHSLTITQLGSSQVDLEWEPPTYQGGHNIWIDGFVIYRKDEITDVWEEIKVITDNETLTFSDNNITNPIVTLTNGIHYHYKVSAYNNNSHTVSGYPGGMGPFSNIVMGRPLTVPDAPIDFELWELGDQFSNITWNEPFTGGVNVPIEGYIIYRMNETALEWREVGKNSPNEYFYYDSGLENGEKYYYRITAWNNGSEPHVPDVMNPGGEGPYSNIIMAKPITTPNAPQDLKIERVNSASIELNWSIPLNNGGDDIDGYILYRKGGSSDWSQIFIGSINDYNSIGNIYKFHDQAVINGRDYYYKVVAINNRSKTDIETIPEPVRLHPGGPGEESNMVSAKPFAPPSEPRNLQANGEDGYNRLVWDAPLNDNGDDIDGYVIYRGTTSENLIFLKDLEISEIDNPSNPFYDDFDVEHLNGVGLNYYYRIAAYNNNSYAEDAYPGGLGENSTNTASATPTFKVILHLMNPSRSDLEGVLANITNIDGNFDYNKLNSSISNGLVSFYGIENSSKLFQLVVYDENWVIFNNSVNIEMATENDFEKSIDIVCNLSNYIFTVKDLEGNIVENATVYMEDSNDPNVNNTFKTNETGKFEYFGIYNSTWNIEINYTNSGNSFEFTLNSSQIEIDTNLSFNTRDLMANLTTIRISAEDPQALLNYESLSGVEITIYSPNLNQNISTIITDNTGEVSFRLPETEYTLYTHYSGKDRVYNASSKNGGLISETYLISHTIDFGIHKDITLFLFINEIPTTLIWENYSFLYESWGTHAISMEEPYFVELYYGDSLNATFFWRNNRDGDGVDIGDLNSENLDWTITYNSHIIADSQTYVNSYKKVPGQVGNFTFTFNTQNAQYPSVGTYLFEVRMGDETYINSTYQIQIKVLNITSEISPVGFTSGGDPIEIQYGEQINLDFEFTSHSSNNPCPISTYQNITDAELNYSVKSGDETIIHGGTLPKKYAGATTATYSFSGIFESLGPATYQLYIYGNQTNYDWAISDPIPILIKERNTTLSVDIPDDFAVQQDMTVSFGENITFSFQYNDSVLHTHLLNGLDIDIEINGQNVSDFVYANLMKTNWITFTIPTPDIINTTGFYTLDMSISLNNYTKQEKSFSVYAVDYWNTDLQLVDPPESAIWGENVSFMVFYKCIQAPRDGLELESSTVSKIDLYAYNEGTSTYQTSLKMDTLGTEWGYSDLGNGFYDIWFDSSALSLNKRTMFYIYPNINNTVYRNGTLGSYIWVSPVSTEVDVYTPYMSFDEHNFNFLPNEYNRIQDNELIRIDYSVNEPNHIFDGLDIYNAGTLHYSIMNMSDGQVIETGNLYDYSGYYGLILFNDKLGQFRVSFEIQKQNYQIINYTFNYEVTKDIEFSIDIDSNFKYDSTTIKTAETESFIFYVNITDGTVNNPNLKISIDGLDIPNTYIHDLGDGLNYTVIIPANEIGITQDSSIEIVVSEELFNTKTERLSLIVQETWQTSGTISAKGSEFYLGENISFYMDYQTYFDSIRSEANLSIATISSIQVYYKDNNENYLQFEFSASSLGTLWDYHYTSYDEIVESDVYSLWFNSGVLNLTKISKSAKFDIEVEIEQIHYENQVKTETIWIRPIDSILESAQGNFIKLDIENSKTFEFLLKVHEDEESPLAGQLLDGASINYYIENETDIIYESFEFTDLGEGRYSITINPSVIPNLYEGFDYTLFVESSLENFTDSIRQVGIDVLPGTVILDVSFEDSITVNPTTMQAANVENIELYIESFAEGVNLDVWIENEGNTRLDMNSFVMISQNKEKGKVWTVSFPASAVSDNPSFGLGQFQLFINGTKAGYIETLNSYNLKIIESWASGVELVTPVQFMPWNSNVSMIIRYYGTQVPRDNVITDAIISDLRLHLITKTGSINRLNLDSSDIEAWGFMELSNDPKYGDGYYRVWFNTSLLEIPETRSYYIEPTFKTQSNIFDEATLSPYLWVRPAYTSVNTSSRISPDLAIDGIQLELNQSEIIYVNYLVSDNLSVMNGLNIGDADLNYTIFKDSDNTIFQTGDIKEIRGTDRYLFNLTGKIIGNYTIRIQAHLMNYEDAFGAFKLVVTNRTLNPIIQYNRPQTNEFESPQNKDLNITINLEDSLTNGELSGATLYVKLLVDGEVKEEFTYTESPNTKGEYYIIIPQSKIEQLEENRAYKLLCSIQKTNYTTIEDFPIFIKVGFRVDPVFGIPYRYWIIGAITLTAMMGLVLARKYYIRKTTPQLILDIRSIRKNIKKDKSISDSKIEKTPKEEIYERFWRKYRIIGIDLAETLDLKRKSRKFKTSTDEDLNDINEQSHQKLSYINREKSIDEEVERLMEEKRKVSELKEQGKDSEEIENLLNLDYEELEKKIQNKKQQAESLKRNIPEDEINDGESSYEGDEKEELADFLDMELDEGEGDNK